MGNRIDPVLICDRRLTGHVDLSSEEPADPPAAEVAVLDPVERLHPAESVGGGSPEPIRVRDGEPVQVRVRQAGQPGAPGARCQPPPPPPSGELR